MKRIPLFSLFTVIISLRAFAQQPEQILNNWSQKNPIEKAYLQFDREEYLAGETAWFKAYLYADYLPDTISTTLYVELLNSDSRLLNRQVVPLTFGHTH